MDVQILLYLFSKMVYNRSKKEVFIMKKFIVGLIVGVMLSILPISAAVQEYICYKASYKVLLNSVEITDATILNYNGYTYYPKSVLEKAGLNVTWNTSLGQEEITSNPTSEQINNVEVETMSIEYDSVTGLPIGAEFIENEKDGRKYNTVLYDEEIYIAMVDLKNLFGIDNKYIDNYGVCFYKDGTQLPVDSRDKTNHFFVSSRLYYKKALFENYMGE
jgi:hypothetical protein